MTVDRGRLASLLVDSDLERYLHPAALNRGILLTPSTTCVAALASLARLGSEAISRPAF